MLIISDTSALSALAETRLLPLLPTLVGTVTITESIKGECLDAGAPVLLRAWMAAPPGWLSVVSDPIAFLEETSALGAGEASAITLAWHHRPASRLILDEKRGRTYMTVSGSCRVPRHKSAGGNLSSISRTIRLKPAIEQRLENLAQRTGRTKTFLWELRLGQPHHHSGASP